MKKKLASLVLAGSMVMGLATGAGAVGADDFSDVKTGDWYYSAVNHATQLGYFYGVSPTMFAPDQGMTRAMAVTVLARRFADSLDGYTGVTRFTDVPANEYYARSVQWAMEKGITDGTSPTKFSPDETLTREQLATFLCRAMDLTLTAPDITFEKFPDKDSTSPWAVNAMKWVTYLGIIRGDDGLLNPQSECTRAMVATIFMNYDEYCGVKPPVTDPDPDPNPNPDPNPDPGPDPSPEPTPDPEPNPDPDPTPDPEPGTDDPAAQEKAMVEEIDSRLRTTWDNLDPNYAVEDPQRDTGYLEQAAQLIASGEQSDAEAALKAVGFDKPIGRTDYDKYTYEEYHVDCYTATAMTGDQIYTILSQRESLTIPGFNSYGIACNMVDDYRYKVAIVIYHSSPYTFTDINQIQRDWLDEQAAIPVTLSAYEQDVLDLVNAERLKAGLNPLKVTADTQAAAKIRAEELTVKCSHTRPDGRDSFSVYEDINSSLVYSSPIDQSVGLMGVRAGENIAWYYKTPADVVNGWMNSSGHRANILKPEYTHMGIAVTPAEGGAAKNGYYWAQEFLSIDPKN